MSVKKCLLLWTTDQKTSIEYLSSISDESQRKVGALTKAKYAGKKEYEATVLMISTDVNALKEKQQAILATLKISQNALLAKLIGSGSSTFDDPGTTTVAVLEPAKRKKVVGKSGKTTSTTSGKTTSSTSGKTTSSTSGKTTSSTSSDKREKLEAQKRMFRGFATSPEQDKDKDMPCSSCVSLRAENIKLLDKMKSLQHEVEKLKKDQEMACTSIDSPFSVAITPKKVKLFEEMASLARRESGRNSASTPSVTPAVVDWPPTRMDSGRHSSWSTSTPSVRPSISRPKQVKLFGQSLPSPPPLPSLMDELSDQEPTMTEMHVPSPPQQSSRPSHDRPSTLGYIPVSLSPPSSPTKRSASSSSGKAKFAEKKKMVELSKDTGVFLTESQLSFIRRVSKKDQKDMLRRLLVALFEPQELAGGCAMGVRDAVNAGDSKPTTALDQTKISAIKDYVQKQFKEMDLEECMLNKQINSKCATVRRGLNASQKKPLM